MTPIGGYFELELQQGKSAYHDTPYALKSGRSSLGCILEAVRPSLVYLPYYTCNGLLEPLELAGVPYRFYKIDSNLEPTTLPELKQNEYLLYINYFDAKGALVQQLSDVYAQQLIVDCTQAFFRKGNGRSWFFNSCRKFFGVPDGSFLYAPEGISVAPVSSSNNQFLVDHLLSRFNGDVAGGYPFFLQNELLCGGAVDGMSKLTTYLLSHVNYEEVAEKRRANFGHLHQSFKELNLLPIGLCDDAVPMYYPLWLKKPIERDALYAQNLFIPTFWKDVPARGMKSFETEVDLTNQLYPIPVDHRYTIEDMYQIIRIINALL